MQKKEAEKLKKRGINPDNPIIGVGFYESMPGRLSVSDHNEYINGILELADTQLIVHKKSVWRGKDRGIKHILYDQIKSIDYDKGKSLSKSSIQLYLTNIEYSFKSSEPNRLKSFYEKLLKK